MPTEMVVEAVLGPDVDASSEMLVVRRFALFILLDSLAFQ